jgi:GAF domain-containing protein
MNPPSTEASSLTAAISGALANLGSDDREILNSTVRVARDVMNAAASSFFLLDKDTDELVFEAVCGEGEGFLVGTRFPADRGIAGCVLATGEPMAVEDLAGNTVFAWDLAERTGYVPSSIMAVPVTYRSDILGVLEVIDPNPSARSNVADLDMLTTFAAQAGLSVQALARGRSAQRALATAGAEFERLAALVQLLDTLGPEHRSASLQIIDSLYGILASLVR